MTVLFSTHQFLLHRSMFRFMIAVAASSRRRGCVPDSESWSLIRWDVPNCIMMSGAERIIAGCKRG